MNTQSLTLNRRSNIVLALLTLFALEGAGCVSGCSDGEPPSESVDHRLGVNKKVRFVGGGCSGSDSVIMPIGAKDTLTIEAANENIQLPADLNPQSSDPSVISVTPGTSPLTIDMMAHKAGKTDIELMSSGQRFDYLTFFAEPAKSVVFTAEPAVLAGGLLGLGISDVYGSCGNESCPMFGHSFVQWSTNPGGALSLIQDEQRIARFSGGTMPLNAEIIGKEPSLGGELVRHPIEIVDPTTVTEISGELIIPASSDQEKEQILPFPATVKANSNFYVRVLGTRQGKSSVAISRHDIVWTVPMGLIQLSQIEPADTVAEAFSADATPGDFGLKVSVALLANKEQTFNIKVVP